jgi:hypothetical protein
MSKISYSGYRFPPEIIQHAIWLYIRVTLSFRDVEDLLAERGIMVSYETRPALSEPFRADGRETPWILAGLAVAGPARASSKMSRTHLSMSMIRRETFQCWQGMRTKTVSRDKRTLTTPSACGQCRSTMALGDLRH